MRPKTDPDPFEVFAPINDTYGKPPLPPPAGRRRPAEPAWHITGPVVALTSVLTEGDAAIEAQLAKGI